MAFQGQMLQKQGNLLEIKARRRLGEEGTFEKLIEDLQNTLADLKESKGMVSDCDLSQNLISPEQFEMVFNTFATGGVRVQRFRLFGCAGFSDQAMQSLADHFRNDLTSETVPAELHLSDCAITSDGFIAFMNMIEETDLFPIPNEKTGKFLPLYVRLENNYIEEATIQEKVDSGIIRVYKKSWGGYNSQDVDNNTIKVNLVCTKDNFQQKQGMPPAPEDAPPPKQVFDRYNQPPDQQQWNQNWQTKGQKGGWQQQRPAWQQPAQQKGVQKGGWAPQQQQQKGGWHAQAQQRPAWQAQIRPGQVTPRQVSPVNLAQGAGKGNAWARPQTQADRSRTPVAVKPPAKVGKGTPKGAGLPHPWEEHWSEEYQIPYYWNSETGDALWEKPTA